MEVGSASFIKLEWPIFKPFLRSLLPMTSNFVCLVFFYYSLQITHYWINALNLEYIKVRKNNHFLNIATDFLFYFWMIFHPFWKSVWMFSGKTTLKTSWITWPASLYCMALLQVLQNLLKIVHLIFSIFINWLIEWTKVDLNFQ